MQEKNIANPKFEQRFSRNLLTNLLSVALSVLVGIFLIPYYLDTLGPIAYGLVPLATSITSYVNIFTNALNTSVSRFLMMYLRAGNLLQANKIYNTAFITILAVVIILLPIALILGLVSPILFNIGDVATFEVQVLFSLIFLSSLITIISANFTATLYSYNRFDLKNTVTIFQTVIQIAGIILLFSLIQPSLVFIGISYLTASILALLLAIIFSRKTCSELVFQKSNVTTASFRELWSMTVWTVVKVLGLLLRSNIGLIIANIICGALIAAHYAIVLQWQTLLISLMASLSILFNPVIFGHCAQENMAELKNFLLTVIRITGVAAALFIGLLTVYAPELLTLWVGSEYAALAIYAVLLILPIFIQSPSDILNNVMIAKLKYRQVAIIYCAAGVLTAIFSVIGAHYLGMLGIILAGGLCIVFIEGGGILLYTSRLIGVRISTILKCLLPGVEMLIITLVFGFLIKMVFSGENFLTLILGGGIVAILSMLVCLRFLLNKDTREFIRSCLPGKLKKLVIV